VDDVKKRENALLVSEIEPKFPGRPSPGLVTLMNGLNQLLYFHRKQEMESIFMHLYRNIKWNFFLYGSQWLHGLRRGSAAARLLGLRVRLDNEKLHSL